MSSAEMLKQAMHYDQARSSLIIEVVEALCRLLLAGRDVATVVDFDHSLGLELRNDCLSLFILLNHLVELGQLLFGSSQLRKLGLGVSLFLGSGFLVSLDLCSCAPSLACLLEEIGADALVH